MRKTLYNASKGSSRNKNYIIYGKFGGITPEGRVNVYDLLVKDNNNIDILGPVGHINMAKGPFKNKFFKKGEVVRFTGDPYKYKRESGLKDFSMKPGKKCRKLDTNELQEYNSWYKEFRRHNKRSTV